MTPNELRLVTDIVNELDRRFQKQETLDNVEFSMQGSINEVHRVLRREAAKLSADEPIEAWRALTHEAKEEVLEILFEKGSHPKLKDAVEIAWKILRRLG